MWCEVVGCVRVKCGQEEFGSCILAKSRTRHRISDGYFPYWCCLQGKWDRHGECRLGGLESWSCSWWIIGQRAGHVHLARLEDMMDGLLLFALVDVSPERSARCSIRRVLWLKTRCYREAGLNLWVDRSRDYHKHHSEGK